MGRNHKPESMENNCSDKDEDAMVVVDGRGKAAGGGTHSVSAIQPADVSHRIKKVMEGLRAEFGAFQCKQFYAIFEPPLRGVDGRRRRLMKSAITSLTFCVTRFALYEIDYDDKSLKSWTKIDEIGH